MSGYQKARYVVQMVIQDSSGNMYVSNEKHYTAIKTRGQVNAITSLQGEGAVQNLKQYGYSYGLASTVSLETNVKTTIDNLPHTTITAMQNSAGRRAILHDTTDSISSRLQEQLILRDK